MKKRKVKAVHKLSLTSGFNFNQWERMVVLPHIHPDGDTLGSSIALGEFLKAQGLDICIINNDRIPANLCFLNQSHFVTSEAFLQRGWEKGSYAAFVVDASDLLRVNDRKAIFDDAAASLCIDHHVTNESFTDYLWLDTEASSTGELVYKLIKACGGQLNPVIAESLYVAISTDTGSFKYDNTSAQTMRITAELMEVDFDRSRTIVEVYQNKPYDQVKLMQIALNHLKLHHNGKVGTTHITLGDLEAQGVVLYDTDGICEAVRDIAGLEVAVFSREVRPGEFKVSTRSKYDFDVAAFSLQFGGGGHKKAAGFTLRGTAQAVTDTILTALEGKVAE